MFSAAGNNFGSLLGDIFPGKWMFDLRPATTRSQWLLKNLRSQCLVSMSVTVDAASKAQWDLSFGVDEGKVLEPISTFCEQGVGHTGNLGCIDGGKKLCYNRYQCHP